MHKGILEGIFQLRRGSIFVGIEILEGETM